jgi:hypothetical protein
MKLIQNAYSIDDCRLEFDRNGYGHAKAKIMKVGPLRYTDQKGTPYFADISLDELKKVQNTAVPMDITIRHPSDLLSPDDVQKHSHGTTLGKPEIREIDGEQWLVDGVILKTKEAINVAESGQLGTSAGYWRDAIEISEGNVKFEDIVPNHLAIGCFSPRAKGAELFSLDSSDSETGRIFELDKQQTPKKKEVRMAKRILNAVKGQGYSVDEAPIEYADESEGAVEKLVMREKVLIGQFDAELDRQKKSFDEKTEEITTKNGELSGENKALKAQVEELNGKLENTMSMDEAKERIKEMSDIKAVAEANGIMDDFETPLEGKRLVVEKVYSTDEYEDGEIDGAYKTIKKNPEDSKKLAASNAALAAAKKKGSMDSNGVPGKVSISQMSMSALKKAKQLKRKGA